MVSFDSMLLLQLVRHSAMPTLMLRKLQRASELPVQRLKQRMLPNAHRLWDSILFLCIHKDCVQVASFSNQDKLPPVLCCAEQATLLGYLRSLYC